MNRLLDTNICVYAIKRRSAIVDRLQQFSPDDLAISAVTLAELWFGALKSSRPGPTRTSVDAFLRPFEVLPFDPGSAEAYADIRLALERSGRRIGERDLLIAATARSRALTVLTHNVTEFARVPGLAVEDWA